MHACVLLAALLFQAAQDDRKVALNADFVWGQRFRAHADNPVLLTIDNPGPTVEGTLVMRWAESPLTSAPREPRPEALERARGGLTTLPVTIPEKSRRRYFVSVRGLGGRGDALWIFLRVGEKYVASWTPIVMPFDDDRVAVGQVGGALIPGLAATGATATSCRADDLPDRWHAYSLLHALVWLDADAGAVRDPAVVDAIRAWVASGGHLVVARANTVGFRGTFLESLVPGRVTGTSANADWSAISPELPAVSASVLDVDPRGATVLAAAGGRPLILRSVLGRGRITLVTFDPCGAPFDAWRGMTGFWEGLLELPSRAAPTEDDRARTDDYGRGWGSIDTTVGSPRVRELLAIHPEIPLPSLGWAFLLIFVYVLLVGPIDYIVLRRLRKMELTWVTFPAIVFVFSTITLAGGSSIASHPPVARETHVVDCLPAEDRAFGHGMASILAPQAATFAVEAARTEAVLAPCSSGLYGDDADVRQRGARVEEWHFARGATGVALLRWCEKGVPVRVKRNGAHVTIETPRALSNVVFIRDGAAYAIGNVPAGSSGHPLDTKIGDWREGVAHAAGGEPETREQRYYVYDEPSRSEGHLRSQMRRATTWLSFHRAHARDAARHGFAGTLDATAWAASKRSLLLAWCEGDSAIRIEGAGVRSSVDVLVRVFLRDD
jgi:hypothetical protein